MTQPCKTCRHYESGRTKTKQTCHHPKAIDAAKAVLGSDHPMVDRSEIDVTRIRWSDALCGLAGRWWEPIT